VEVGLEDDSVGGLFPTATVLRIVSPCRAAVVFCRDPLSHASCEQNASFYSNWPLRTSSGRLRENCAGVAIENAYAERDQARQHRVWPIWSVSEAVNTAPMKHHQPFMSEHFFKFT